MNGTVKEWISKAKGDFDTARRELGAGQRQPVCRRPARRGLQLARNHEWQNTLAEVWAR